MFGCSEVTLSLSLVFGLVFKKENTSEEVV